MKTSLKRFRTSDALELVGLLYEPETSTKKVLVHVHGMAGNFYENQFLDFLARTLTDNGIAFFVFNNRGCELVKDLVKIEGEKRQIVRIGDAYEKFEDSRLDIRAAVDFVESLGFVEIHLSGHSLGSPKVAYYVSEQKDERIKSVLFLSPSDMVGLAKQDKNHEQDVENAKQLVRENRGNEFMPNLIWEEYIVSANTFFNLSGENSKVAIFNFYDSSSELTTLNAINVPVIIIMGRQDGALTVSIEETMDRVKKALISSPKVETMILGEANHGYDGYGQQLADVVVRWISGL